MKNLITITSILAAGTLCANAATVIYSFETAHMGTNITNITTSSLTNSVYTQTLGSFVFSATMTDAKNATYKSDITFGSASSWTATNNMNSFLSATGLALADVKAQSGAMTANPATFSFSGLTTTTIYTIALLFTSYDKDNKVSLSLTNGTLSSGSYGEIGGTSMTTISSTSGTLISDVSTTATVFVAEITPDSTGKIVISAAGDSSAKLGLVSIAGLTNIPEPSMFGLLAGTLALGLAGTRRRRRAK